MADSDVDRVLEHVDPSKRAFLKSLVVGSAFVAPLVASFSLDGLSVYRGLRPEPGRVESTNRSCLRARCAAGARASVAAAFPSVLCVVLGAPDQLRFDGLPCS